MKKIFYNFLHDEDGAELLEWAIIVIIVAGIAALAYSVSTKMTAKVQEASSVLDGIGTPSVPSP